MAINVTTAYREALKQSAITTKFKAEIIIDGVSHTVYDEDLSDKSPQTDYSISSGNEIGFGTAGSASFSCEIINKDYLWSNRSLIGAKIVPSMGIVIPETGLPEYVTLGTFIIDDAFVNGTVVEIKALDEMVLLDKYTLADLTGIIYPCSHSNMYNQICNFMSMRYVEFFPDSNWLIPDLGEDKNKKTLRDVLSFIAFCSAGYARITRDGLLEIRRLFPDTAFKNEIANSNSKEIKVGVQPSVITGLSYEHRDNPIELGNDDGVNISIKPDNLSPFVYSETEPDPEGDGRDEDTNVEEIRLILNNVFEKINGKEYYPFTSSVIQDPSMEVGDFATIQSIDNTGEPLMVDSIITDIRFRYFDTWAAVSCKGSTKVTAGLATGRDKTIGDAAMSAGETIKRVDRRHDRELRKFAELTAINKGLFSTVEEQDDGSFVFYEHDKPTLSESMKVWKRTADAYSYSFDGGVTWHGYDVYGNQMANVIEAVGVKGEWISLESPEGETKKLTDELEEIDGRIGTYERQLEIKAGMIAMLVDKGYGLEQAMTLTDEKLSFYVSGMEKVYIGLDGMYIETAIITNRLRIGNHTVQKFSDGYTAFSWTGEI